MEFQLDMRRTQQYDMFMRLPIIAISSFFLWRDFNSLRGFVITHPFFDGDWNFLISLSARIGMIFFLVLLVVFHAARYRSVSGYTTFSPRIAALMGMGLAYLLLLFPRADQQVWYDLASSTLLFIGNFLCLISVTTLGRSLSIMPEARKLVTDGVYTHIRHPLYLAEMISDLGILLQYRSFITVVILMAVFYFQLRRIHWEEQILAETFPEYKIYRCTSWRLLPRIY